MSLVDPMQMLGRLDLVLEFLLDVLRVLVDVPPLIRVVDWTEYSVRILTVATPPDLPPVAVLVRADQYPVYGVDIQVLRLG